MKSRFSFVMLTLPVLLAAVFFLNACGQPGDNSKMSLQSKMHLEGVNQLLDVLDSLVSRNPSRTSLIEWAKTVDVNRVQDSVSKLIQRNGEDRVINKMIDDLLESPTYELYYIQFTNTSPATHKKILLSLPFRAPDSPASIADNLKELCQNREVVRSWAQEVVAKISLERSDSLAREWVPKGDYTIPDIYFLYDGNGGGFARRGSIGVDLFTSVLVNKPGETRFANLSDINVDYLERLLAHELQHIYTTQRFGPPRTSYPTWQEQMEDRIVIGLVHEGVAAQCYPPTGFKEEVWNDTATAAFWIAELNQRLADLKARKENENEVYQWWSDSYQATPKKVLRSYLGRQHAEADLDRLVQEHILDRPDLEHSLGWWMITRINGDGSGKGKVIQLLAEPQKLYEFYNEVMKGAADSLKVNI